MGLFRRRGPRGGSRAHDDDRREPNTGNDDPAYAAWFADVIDSSGQPVPYKRPLTAPVYPQLQEPREAIEQRPHEPRFYVQPHYSDTYVPRDELTRDEWFPADQLGNEKDEKRHIPTHTDIHPHTSQLGQAANDPANPSRPPPAPPPTRAPTETPSPPTPELPDRTTPTAHHPKMPLALLHNQGEKMSNIDKILNDLMRIDGATGVAVVDADSGMVLGMAGNPAFSLEYAGSGNSEVVRAKLRTMSNLGITDTIEDILITLTNQYHLIRLIETPGLSTLFTYLVLDRTRANLALARHKLGELTPKIEI